MRWCYYTCLYRPFQLGSVLALLLRSFVLLRTRITLIGLGGSPHPPCAELRGPILGFFLVMVKGQGCCREVRRLLIVTTNPIQVQAPLFRGHWASRWALMRIEGLISHLGLRCSAPGRGGFRACLSLWDVASARWFTIASGHVNRSPRATHTFVFG